MLCDVTKVHTGYWFMPKVTHTSEDEDWGKIGSSKKIHVAQSLTQKGGFGSVDHILEREENKYWKIQVDEFQTWMMGFYKMVGEWETKELAEGRIHVSYSYTLFSNKPIYYPLNYIFIKTFWRVYMRRVMENIRTMAYNEEPYLYA